MSEHKHEWVIDDDYRWFKCACGASPSTEDILRSLNAIECLSSDEAESIAMGLPDEYSMLNDYARVLKGKE